MRAGKKYESIKKTFGFSKLKVFFFCDGYSVY